MDKFYVWADGTISDEILNWKSDDFITITEDTTILEILEDEHCDDILKHILGED